MHKLFKSITKQRLYTVIAISIAVHLLVGVFYGGMVLFEKFVPPEPELVAPPIPKGLEPRKKEYKVKMEKSQKNSAAPLPVPIVAEIPSNLSLDNIDLNVTTPTRDQRVRGAGSGDGFGKGFGGGLGGDSFDIEFSEFGYNRMMDGLLTGTLYDLKRKRSGKPDRDFEDIKGNGMNAIQDYAANEIISKFIDSWNTKSLERNYYKADKNLYASFWIIPNRKADAAPAAFGVADEVEPRMVIVTYEGQFTPREGGRFRFYGKGDDLLIVRINGKIVFDGSWREDFYSDHRRNSSAKRDDTGENFFGLYSSTNAEGDHGNWFNLIEGETTDIEILIGEIPGGDFGCWLTIEKEGGTGPYIFSTKPLTEEERANLQALHPDVNRFLN